jgi:very-short-patch-repair endonuclease
MNKQYAYEKLIKIRNNQIKLRKELSKKVNPNKRIQRNKNSSLKLRENQISLNNPNEKEFKFLLYEMNISFVWQKPFSDFERYVCVDFFLPNYNIVIEIDGIIHNKYYDLQRTIYLKNIHKVYKVVRFTNYEIVHNIKYVKDYLINLLEKWK